MKKEIINLLAAQVSSPLARIVFALFLIPFHPRGGQLLEILVISEMLSVFLTGGRSYLLQAGFVHKILPLGLERFLLLSLACIAYFVFSTEQQRELINGIVVATATITLMTMCNSFFLVERRLLSIAPCNLIAYSILSISIYSTTEVAWLAVVIWLTVEWLIPSSTKQTKNFFMPMLATFLAFLSQRVDLQIAAYFDNSDLLKEVFQANAFFMPMAVLVRVIGNTALLRGGHLLNGGLSHQFILFVFGVLYCIALYVAGKATNNTLVIEYFFMFALSVMFSSLNIPCREKISVLSRRDEFRPVLILSVLGVLPSVVYFISIQGGGVNSVGSFVFFLYFLPRFLMFFYGVVFVLRKQYGG